MRRCNSALGVLVLAAIAAVGSGRGSAQEMNSATPASFKLIEAPRPAEKPRPAEPALTPPTIVPVAHPASTPPTIVPAAPPLEMPARPMAVARSSGPAITLLKRLLSPVGLGQRFSYELVIRNMGTAPANQVMVEDEIPSELTLVAVDPRPEIQGNRIGWGVGTLEPGAERRCKIEAKMNQGLRELPPATVTYSVGCELSPATHVTAKPEVGPTLAPSPLALTVTGPQTVTLGESATFQIEMTNTHGVPLKGVLLRDILPAGLKHVQGHDIEADLAPLGPFETRKIALTAIAAQAGPQINQAVVTATEGPGMGPGVRKLEARASTTVLVIESAARIVPATGVQVAVLGMDIRNKDNVTEVGAETTYEIRVVNQGSATGTAVQIMALLPDGMEARGANGPAAFRLGARQVIFEPLASLDPGKEALYRVRVICQRAGDWRFKVQLVSDQLRLPVCKEESLRVYSDR